MSFSAAYSVLCVDDDKDACEMLSALLECSNIEAVCVQSAEEALALLKVKTFDLYLLDSWLPGIDGFELCRRIRRFDPFTPILFYSGAAYEADRQRGIQAGANAYFIKPNVDNLVEQITHYVKSDDEPSRRATIVKSEGLPRTESNSGSEDASAKAFSASAQAYGKR